MSGTGLREAENRPLFHSANLAQFLRQHYLVQVQPRTSQSLRVPSSA
ncbi:Uncharacterised protein [Vibrio cholerae]|nr:Uncharacterised protein [Vibrio cholerae]